MLNLLLNITLIVLTPLGFILIFSLKGLNFPFQKQIHNKLLVTFTLILIFVLALNARDGNNLSINRLLFWFENNRQITKQNKSTNFFEIGKNVNVNGAEIKIEKVSISQIKIETKEKNEQIKIINFPRVCDILYQIDFKTDIDNWQSNELWFDSGDFDLLNFENLHQKHRDYNKVQNISLNEQKSNEGIFNYMQKGNLEYIGGRKAHAFFDCTSLVNGEDQILRYKGGFLSDESIYKTISWKLKITE